MSPPRKQIFEQIYTSHSWNGRSRSGPGSDVEHTTRYIRFVSGWLRRHPDVRRVVELGCGDWSTTKQITFLSHQFYVGLDIVSSAVEANSLQYERPGVYFECLDFLSETPPTGDVLFIKDVLQHLSNRSVQHFLSEVLPLYRHALITNDVSRYTERRFCGIPLSRTQLGEANADIPDGGSRPIRLHEPPFNLGFEERFSYPVVLQSGKPRVVYVKDVLVCNGHQPRANSAGSEQR
jgi:SAM-dependent methyltransferase